MFKISFLLKLYDIMDVFIYHNICYIYVIRWSFSGRHYIIMYFFFKISMLVVLSLTFFINKKFFFFKLLNYNSYVSFDARLKLTEYFSSKYKNNSILENIIFYDKYDSIFFYSGLLLNFFIPIFFLFITDEYWFLDYTVFVEDWVRPPYTRYVHAYDLFFIKDYMSRPVHAPERYPIYIDIPWWGLVCGGRM